MILPEFVLFNLVKSAFSSLKAEYLGTPDKTTTLLYHMFHGSSFEKFDYYEQAVELFTRIKTHPRCLETRLFFDASRAEMPTVHLSLPGESSGEDGIGVDEGYVDPIFNEADQTYRPVYTRLFNASYNLIITSDNTFEVLVIYHALRAMIISMTDYISMNGLINMKLGGQDLQINSELVPVGIFFRAITIDVKYEVSIPKLVVSDYYNDIWLNGLIVDEFGVESKPWILDSGQWTDSGIWKDQKTWRDSL